MDEQEQFFVVTVYGKGMNETSTGKIEVDDIDEFKSDIKQLLRLFKEIKDLSHLSLDCAQEGTFFINPDNIESIRVYGSTEELRAIIQEYA